MLPYKDPFKDECLNAALTYFEKNSPTKEDISYDSLSRITSTPPDFNLGQLAIPCFIFAKKLQKSPSVVANEIQEFITTDFKKKYILRVEAAGPYLNFFLDFNTYGKTLVDSIQNKKFFEQKLISSEKKEKNHVEYSQPNTHKAMHVGHLRCLVLGDAISNLLQYAGHDVVKATYPGDMGAHIAKVLWYIVKNKLILPTENHMQWLGKIYAEADEALKISSEKESVQIKEEIGIILSQLQEKTGIYYDLYLITRQWSLDFMKKTYAWLKVTFDQWFYESECDVSSRQLVIKKFEEGVFAKSEGAIGIDLSDYKLGFAMLLKSDGNGLYLTKDLELIRQKFDDPTVTRSIVVVDARQKLHFQQLFKIAEILGYEQAKKSIHISYETVNTADGSPFSSRDLNGVDLWQMRKLMEDKVTDDYLKQYRGQWSDDDIQNTAEIVATGALKYGMLHVDSNTKINFILEDWLRLDGDTGPYFQYVHARCQKILEKLGFATQGFDFVIASQEEKSLLHHLGRFNEFALQAAENYRPHIMANYLYDLAKCFNRFYENCPIKSENDINLRNTRLSIVAAIAQTIRKGLGLLGIEAPNRM